MEFLVNFLSDKSDRKDSGGTILDGSRVWEEVTGQFRVVTWVSL